MNQESFDLLTKTIFGNIIKNPNEIKFQTLKKSNVKLEKHLSPEFVKFLIKGGFEETDSLFIFKGEVEKLSFYVKDLEKKYQDKVKVDENEVDLDKLTDLILEFVSNTAISQLDNLYEMYGSSIPSLKDRSKILTHFTLEYMNKCLTSLVLKNDKFIVDWFERFWAHCSHSPTCLLQILLQWTCYVHDSIDFDDLDCKSLEKFQKEVKLNIEYIINHVRDYVRKNLNHKCSGVKLEDIKPYDRIQKEDWSK